jgi:hypothetical protein
VGSLWQRRRRNEKVAYVFTIAGLDMNMQKVVGGPGHDEM